MGTASWLSLGISCSGSTYGEKTYNQPDEDVTKNILTAESKLKKQGWHGGIDQPWGKEPDAPVSYMYGKKFGDLTCDYQLLHARSSNSLQGGLQCYSYYSFLDKLQAPNAIY